MLFPSPFPQLYCMFSFSERAIVLSLLAAVPLVLGLTLWLVCSGTALCNRETNQRFFSCSYGKSPKLLQSTACQLVMGSHEVVLATGRRGGLVFVFMLSLSGIAQSSRYSRNAFDVEDTHAVLAKI